MAEVLLSPAAANEAFNITRGEGHTLREVIDILRPLFPELEVDVMVNDETFRSKRGALDEQSCSPHRLEAIRLALEGMMRYVEGFEHQSEPHPALMNGEFPSPGPLARPRSVRISWPRSTRS